MFFRKNQTSEQTELKRQVITFILVQGVIFSTLLFISRLTGIEYSLLLMLGGVAIALVLLPSNLELNSYIKSANSMGGHNHQEILQQIRKMRLGWNDSLERLSIGLIPLAAGIVIAFL
jgi:hypothetical protein